MGDKLLNVHNIPINSKQRTKELLLGTDCSFDYKTRPPHLIFFAV